MSLLDTVEAVAGNVAARIREKILAWAAREEARAKERRAKLENEAKEAQDWLIQQVTEGMCVHTPQMSMTERGKWVYCDDCPLGSHRGELSWGAQRLLCSRSKHYSK